MSRKLVIINIFIAIMLFAKGFAFGSSADDPRSLALRLICQAADAGSIPAASACVGSFKDAKAPAQRVQAALMHLERSARSGHDEARNALARLLLDGAIIPRDSYRAFALLEEGASFGSPTATIALAHMLETGDGIPVNLVSAFIWYRVASERGAPMAEAGLLRLTKRLSQSEIAAGEAFAKAFMPASGLR